MPSLKLAHLEGLTDLLKWPQLPLTASERYDEKVAQRGGDDFAKAYDNANQFNTDQMLQYRRGVGGRGTASAKAAETLQRQPK